MSNLSEQIIELRNKDYSYNEISEKLGCSKSTVAY
jgi:orotate phosphoribosyltransferase-like protein